MIIKSLKMENYRPYRKPPVIDFATGNKSITVIMGDNDLGKTTILDAISWCIYGEEHYKKNNDDKLYNKNAGINLKKGNKLDVIVEVVMEDNDNKLIKFRRKQQYVKKSNGKIHRWGSDDFVIYNITSGNDDKITPPKSYVDTNLPKNLREYYLFDGERLLEWFSTDSHAVKKSIGKLSQLNLIENVSRRTNDYFEVLSQELDDLNPKKAEYVLEKKNLEVKHAEDKKNLEKNQSLLDEESNSIDVNMDKIKELGSDPDQVLNEINSLNEDIADFKSQKKEINEDHVTYLLNKLPLVLGYPLLNDVLHRKIVDFNEDTDFSFDEDDLDYLLERGTCLCGNDLSDKENDCYKNIVALKKKLIENNAQHGIRNSFKDLTKDSKKLLNRYPKDMDDIIDKYVVKIAKLDNKIKKKESELKIKEEIYDDIKDKDEEYRRLTEEISTSQDLIRTYDKKINNYKKNIQEYPAKLRDVNERIAREEAKSDEEVKINNKIKFCSSVVETCEILSRMFMNKLHDNLSENVNDEFKRIYNGDGERNKYKSIVIDKSFNISFEELDGTLIPPSRPSSGAQLAAALSFITAINSSSGFKLPQIMDTSLGRWGDRLRRNFAEILPAYSIDKQMIFLFLDSEYNSEFRKKIDDNVGKRYRLIFIDENETDIEEWEDKYE